MASDDVGEATAMGPLLLGSGVAAGEFSRMYAPPPMNRNSASSATPMTSTPPPPPPVGSAMAARRYPLPPYFAASGSLCRHRLQKVAPAGLRRPQLGQINVFPQERQ
jgi:hypothetical protein